MVIEHQLKDQSGQSILEVVFVLPFLFLFVGLLFKLNLGLQQSINNTQYARSQVYVLTANSPEYPRLQFRINNESRSFVKLKQDRIVLGVADPEALTSSVANEKDIDPVPQTQKISRNKTVKGSEDAGEVTKRSNVRIRNTSAICTQINNLSSRTARWPFGQSVCQYSGMEDS